MQIVKKCDELERRVNNDANLCGKGLAHIERGNATARERALRQLLEELQRPILRIDTRVATLCETLDSSRQSEILKWISSIPYQENHLTAAQGRTNETGLWLLRHEHYLEWRKSSESTILWLHGSRKFLSQSENWVTLIYDVAGTGKTKLISKVVDDLKETFARITNDEELAFFYCDRNQDDHQDPERILSSLVRQLSTFGNHSSIQRAISELYKEEEQAGWPSGRLKFEKSQVLLTQLVNTYPQVTIVIDALDEFNRESRERFVNFLSTLANNSPTLLKICISSRPDADVKDWFEGGPNIEIAASENGGDIALFVQERLDNSPALWRKKVGPALRQRISETVVGQGDGM